MKNKLRKDFINRKGRYRIGFLLFISYLICQIASNAVNHLEPNIILAAYTITCISISSLFIILIIHVIKERIKSNSKQERMMSLIYSNYYYFYNKRKNKELALEDLEDYQMNSSQNFSNNLHKLAILQMIIIYSWKLFETISSMPKSSLKSENCILIIFGLITALILSASDSLGIII